MSDSYPCGCARPDRPQLPQQVRDYEEAVTRAQAWARSDVWYYAMLREG